MVGAPTGTVSRLALCSAAIEPHPDVNEDGEYRSWILTHHPGSPFTDRVYVDHRSPAFVPASRVTLEQHVRMQAAWQRYTDQAISKTINCPAETTREELSDAVLLAWELGCKGVTVLRESSRENVVIGDADCNGGACALPVT
jgi:ribonucleoside-diphosphate reductase alpha chain